MLKTLSSEKAELKMLKYTVSITERLKHIVSRHKIKKQELAKLLGISYPTLTQLMEGTRPITFEQICRIEATFDVKLFNISSFKTIEKQVKRNYAKYGTNPVKEALKRKES